MDILFTAKPPAHTNTLALGVFSDNTLTKAASDVDLQIHGRLRHGLEYSHFTGKLNEVMVLNAPHGLQLDRIVAVGLGDKAELNEAKLTELGGTLYTHIAKTGFVKKYGKMDQIWPIPDQGRSPKRL